MDQEQKMCPFCHLLVEDELCDPIENNFFGEPANIKGIPSCDGCAIVALMDDDGGAWMVEALKKEGVLA